MPQLCRVNLQCTKLNIVIKCKVFDLQLFLSLHRTMKSSVVQLATKGVANMALVTKVISQRCCQRKGIRTKADVSDQENNQDDFSP